MCIFAPYMNDMTELFDLILRQSGSVDIAESDFKKMIYEDAPLRRQYRDWCNEYGYSERNGFMEYCREYIERQAGMWNVFNSEYNEDL